METERLFSKVNKTRTAPHFEQPWVRSAGARLIIHAHRDKQPSIAEVIDTFCFLWTTSPRVLHLNARKMYIIHVYQWSWAVWKLPLHSFFKNFPLRTYVVCLPLRSMIIIPNKTNQFSVINFSLHKFNGAVCLRIGIVKISYRRPTISSWVPNFLCKLLNM